MQNSTNTLGPGAPTEQQFPIGTHAQQSNEPNLNLDIDGSGNVVAFANVPATSTAARSRKSRSSKASSRALRASLELQRLEEEKRLEKEFIAKKYDILQAQLEQDEEGSSSSSRTRRTSRGSSQRTHDWVQSQLVPTTSSTTGPKTIPVGTQSRTGAIPKQVPAIPVMSSITTTNDSSALCMQSLSISANPMDPAAPDVPQTVSSSFAPTRRLDELQMQNNTHTTGENNTTDFGEAAGGIQTFSTDYRVLPTALNFSISPTRTPEALMNQMRDLQKHMDSLQTQLAARAVHPNQNADRIPVSQLQQTVSSTVGGTAECATTSANRP